MGGWKRIKYQELDQDYQDHGDADDSDNDEMPFCSASVEGLIPS